MKALSRRSFLTSAATGCAGLALQSCNLLETGGRGRTRRPNFLIIVADDLRADVLGYAGDPRAHTPHLDRLAAKSVRFDDNFVTTSICPSSRASLLTGQYASRHRIWDFARGLSQEQLGQSFPALLRRAGYFNGFAGKYGIAVGSENATPENWFDVWDVMSGQGRYWQDGQVHGPHLSEDLAARAVDILRDATIDKPFCLCVHFKAPHVQDELEAHDPFQPHPADLAFHEKTWFPPSPSATEAHFSRLPAFLRSSEARRRWQTRFVPSRYQESVRRYYGLVTGLDRAVGRVLAGLDGTGRRADTVVIFSSDNGFFLGEHGLAGKWFGFEESIRTPLLVQPLGSTLRKVVREPTLNIDLAPTLLDLAGLPAAPGMQGRSLAPLWSESSPVWRSDFLYEHRFVAPARSGLRIPCSEGLRNGRYKYLAHYEEAGPNEMIFDLEKDPFEERNLIAQVDASLLERLRARTAELKAEVE